jgi:hypothetical protein
MPGQRNDGRVVRVVRVHGGRSLGPARLCHA